MLSLLNKYHFTLFQGHGSELTSVNQQATHSGKGSATNESTLSQLNT